MAGDLGDARLILLEWTLGAFFRAGGRPQLLRAGVNFPASGGESSISPAYGPTGDSSPAGYRSFAGFSAPIAPRHWLFRYSATFFRLSPVERFDGGRLRSFSITLGGGQAMALL